MRTLIVTIIFIVSWQLSFSQGKSKEYYSACIAFWNVENLYDTINEPSKNDEEFLPSGANRWNTERYRKKLDRLSEVIEQLGTEFNPTGPVVLGLAEIENIQVLNDLVKQPRIASRNYQPILLEGPDRRGVDVALLYNPAYFKLLSKSQYILNDPADTSFATRGQLLVSGMLDNERIHFVVAHWPSRRGGEKRSRPKRLLAAQLGRHIIDSIQKAEPGAKIIYMGDLNDDPVNESVMKGIKASAKKTDTTSALLYNPMWSLYKEGIGTLAWNDSWNLFDQMLMTTSFMALSQNGFSYHAVRVFNKPYLRQDSGNFKGYPFRTFAGGSYIGGYADHFPVYIMLKKEVK
jgi:hypothetical protein